jgi:hypothetical protein
MPSTVISTFTYDPETRSLRIEFRSGLVYEYLDVPQMVFDDMKNSPAKGIYLNRHIKGHYEFRKLSEVKK